jgi:hypothetical protein
MNIKNSIKKIKKRFNTKITVIVIFVILIIVSFSTFVVLKNKTYRQMEVYTEVTFLSPTQALIFWKSKDETLGYVKYGDKKYGHKNVELQTSSEPGEVHVVFLENIPIEGIYIQKINENDSFLIFPPVQYIKYDTNEEINE